MRGQNPGLAQTTLSKRGRREKGGGKGNHVVDVSRDGEKREREREGNLYLFIREK